MQRMNNLKARLQARRLFRWVAVAALGALALTTHLAMA
jgi:hypothetical protein